MTVRALLLHTPQAAVLRAKPPICIAHAPGHMLVTDVRNSEWALP